MNKLKMRYINYSEEEFEELFNFNISEKDRFLLKILFISTFVLLFVLIILITYYLFSNLT